MDEIAYYELQRTGSAWTYQCPQYAQRAKDAFDTLGNCKGLKVADVGCGDGEVLRHMIDRGARAFGYELSHEKVAKALTRGVYVTQFDLDRFASSDEKENSAAEELEGTFDIVFCSHTLEHTKNCLISTTNLFRMTKPGGTLLIIVPVEEAFPEANPSHTQHMNSVRLGAIKGLLSKHFRSVEERRLHRIENECWFLCKEKL